MAKFRIAKDGIKMAKSSSNVDTAGFSDLIFSTDFPTLRVRYTDLITAGTWAGDWANVYDRAVVTYPVPFLDPPIVLVGGRVSANESDQKSCVFTNFWTPGQYSYRVPWYTVNSLKDRFELYVLARLGDGTPIPNRTKTYRYYVFDSLIEAT